MPGVPPDAVDNVKKLFKGLFKRGKKKQDTKPAEPTPPASNQPPATSTTQQAPAAPNSGAPNTDKPLPPTNPTESTPPSGFQQPAVPKSDAQTGPVDSTQKLRQEVDSQGVSPTSTSPAAASEPVSALEGSTPPAPPPKNDAPVEAPKTADIPANKENVAPPAAAAAAAPKVETAPTAPVIAPAQPNGTAAEATKVEQPTNGEKVANAAEEKVPVHEEPPPVKALPSAPGMSATSGPLEDFPEGDHQ
ncbi:hypothetical protein PRZ48_001408 [Zasmidium cellare]|uniref:Uncharacterized protein n=1 Tax=Zasmidium cellare TaxID=395010 RepID=A0ABR0F320_ZASCE|nr:hypothetical protein PRZ48_001408 [Zasmidium cellare]